MAKKNDQKKFGVHSARLREPYWGLRNPYWGLWEPYWGLSEPYWGLGQPYWGLGEPYSRKLLIFHEGMRNKGFSFIAKKEEKSWGRLICEK